MKDYAQIAQQYCEEVTSGDILAAKYVVLACKRHISELKLQQNDSFLYRFDPRKAAKVCAFVELQYHTKGKWAQQKRRLVLEPWQIFFICSVFGWVSKETDKRRYLEALLLVPRKNGKSALAAALGLYMLAADDEYGAEVYSGATSEKQAKEVFTPARIMAQKNEDMKAHFEIMVNASNLCINRNGSKFEPVIGKPGDGASPSCAIADEVHEHKTRELIDTMITGMGAREQPLMLYLTTAGDNVGGPCYEMQTDAQRMLEGSVENNMRFFALIYGIDPDDDWTDIRTLRKANPNYGVSVGEDFLSARLQDALSSARKQSSFKTKHLNVWVGSMDAFFNMEDWRKSADPTTDMERFYGKPCYIGLDLASRVDIAALQLVFPEGDKFHTFGRYYLPNAALEQEAYRAWDDDGYMTITEGNMIDFGRIKEDILHFMRVFEVRELAFDPWQATQLITELTNAGAPCIEVRATVNSFSEPMKTLDGLIRERKVLHDDNPCMNWMMSNVVARIDAKDNVFPRKEKPENKIDGPVALIMAISRCIIGEDNSIDDALNDLIAATL